MLRAKPSAIVRRLLSATIGLACLAGCAQSAARREELASPYPLDRARAAVQLAEAGDPQAVDLLIELLDDRDRGVRMYSILALERLCGQTYGYGYYDPEPQRAAGVARWREARKRGEVTLLSRPAKAGSRDARGPQPKEHNARAATDSGQSGSRLP